MVVLGGLETETTALNEIRPFALKKWPSWSLGSTLGSLPPARSGHVAVDRRTNGQVMYGGRTANGVALRDVWVLNRLDSDAGVTWRWADTTASIQSDPNWGRPGERSGHSALLSEKGDTLWIFGGKGPNSVVYNDVWRLHFPGALRWERVSTAGTAAPAPRYGHTAVLDPGQTFDGNSPKLPVMVVFGGRTSGGSPADTVWGLSLSQIGTPTWSVLATGGPSARSGHTAVMDPRRQHSQYQTPQRQMVASGGEGVSGYLNDLWVLSRLDTGIIPGPWSWHQVAVPPGPRPSARTGHTAIYDDQMARLTLFGGDTLLASGGFTNDTWAISMWADSLTTDQTKTASWVRLQPNYPPSARMGHTALFESVPERTKIPERFTLSAGHDWERLDNAPKLQPLYPFMFLQSDGKLAEVGPGRTTRRLDLATQSWTTIAPSPFDFDGGSAVMYRPDLVMKCGEQGGEGAKGIHGETATIDLVAPTPTWSAGGSMVPRANHNLTVLPTGQVLATGGLSEGAVYRNAQLWDPNTNTWTVKLAADLAIRKYHSAAALLPDGRVLSTGGDPSEQSKTIYTPPYLFKRDLSGALATRPVITAKPESLGWGRTFTICTPEAASIPSACLIKPSAVTHSFNQDQRYLPLTITAASNPARLLAVAPASGNHAPPGDYLLFVVNQDSVPAIARWVRIGSPAGLDLCDVTPPDSTLDLAADCNPNVPNGWILSWTARGDDASLAASGPAAAFDLRRNTTQITDANWAQSTPMSAPTPEPVGTLHTLSISTSGANRYLRLKTRDDNNNQSALSNQVVIFPWSSGGFDCLGGGGLFAGGGGGGGLRAQPASGLASVQSAAALTIPENSLLDGVRAGSKGRDAWRLATGITTTSASLALRVRESAGRATALDQVRLLAVDHPAEITPYGLGGNIMLGTRQAAARVTAADGTDLTATLAGGGSYSATSGESLSVSLGPGGGGSPLVVEASGAWPSALDVLGPDGTGGWLNHGRCSPRRAFDELTLAAPGSDDLRLVVLGSVTLRFVGRLAVAAAAPTVQAASLLAASTTRLGDVSTLVSGADSVSAALVGPDTLALAFAPAPLAAGMVRSYFLTVSATPVTSRTLAQLQPVDEPRAAPTRFALRQNRPNPFTATTTVRFDLPGGAMVRLEVFDAQGRRVEVLANRYHPAGSHAVSWNPSASGNRIGPGVYFYRIEAGGFRDRKKMTLLP